MDATVIVAITGVVGTSTGAILSYRAGLATAREETKRLREQHREEERRNRQGTYHQLVALVNEVMWSDRKRIRELLNQWYFINAGIALFGAPAVVEKARPLSKVLAEGADNPNDKWREETISAAREVVAAMREDIGVAPLSQQSDEA
jgi:hypothetical protein